MSGCGRTQAVIDCPSCGYYEESTDKTHELSCTKCDRTGEIDYPCQHGYTRSHQIMVNCNVCSGTGICDHQFSDWEYSENDMHKRTCSICRAQEVAN